MLLNKIFIAAIFAAVGVSAEPAPDVIRLRQKLENSIYERDMAKLGLSRREDHPNPEMVAREVEDTMRRWMPDLLKRIHVDCHTILNHCNNAQECLHKSLECVKCVNHKCSE